jgi:small nuclear ribonucleoprotein (snRNP)-like protein
MNKMKKEVYVLMKHSINKIGATVAIDTFPKIVSDNEELLHEQARNLKETDYYIEKCFFISKNEGEKE